MYWFMGDDVNLIFVFTFRWEWENNYLTNGDQPVRQHFLIMVNLRSQKIQNICGSYPDVTGI